MKYCLINLNNTEIGGNSFLAYSRSGWNQVCKRLPASNKLKYICKYTWIRLAQPVTLFHFASNMCETKSYLKYM